MIGINYKKIINCIVLLAVILSCDEKTADPPRDLFVTSIWAGGTQILNINQARGGAPVFINFSTTINKSTATDAAVSIKSKGTPINIDILALPESIVLTPVKVLLENTPYTIEVNQSILSKEGKNLKSNLSVEFTTHEPTRLYFYEVVDAPTATERIRLKNNGAFEVNLTLWSITNKTKTKSYNFPTDTVIPPGQFMTISHETLGFDIDDENEELNLLQNGLLVSSWHN
jgi:hypothetical protein